MPIVIPLAGPHGTGNTFINGLLRDRAEVFQFVNPDEVARPFVRHPPASRALAAQTGGPSGARRAKTPRTAPSTKIAFGAAGSADLAPLVGG